jgi:hypothetical protein
MLVSQGEKVGLRNLEGWKKRGLLLLSQLWQVGLVTSSSVDFVKSFGISLG